MPESPEDFWPAEIPDPSDPMPVALLKEQAELLGRKTGGEIEGVVTTMAENGRVFYSLNLKADALGDYLFKLLSIDHPAIGLSGSIYPIKVEGGSIEPPRVIMSDTQFREWLRDQLSSDYVRSALGNMKRYIRERRSTRVG